MIKSGQRMDLIVILTSAHCFLSCKNAIHDRDILMRGFPRHTQHQNSGFQGREGFVLADPVHV